MSPVSDADLSMYLICALAATRRHNAELFREGIGPRPEFDTHRRALEIKFGPDSALKIASVGLRNVGKRVAMDDDDGRIPPALMGKP